MTTIKIFDNCGKQVLTTDEQSYERDIEKLEPLYWHCRIAYETECIETYYPAQNHLSPRKITKINGRMVYAEYTLFAEDYEVDKEKILKALNEDFKTTKQPVELHKFEVERWAYLRQTSQPINKHLQPVASEALAELKDE